MVDIVTLTHTGAVVDQAITDIIALKAIQVAITAGTPQTQTGATQLTAFKCQVTIVGSDGDGVKMPPNVAGDEVLILNDDAAQNIQIWPSTGDTIDGGTVNAADTNVLAVAGRRRYLAIDGTDWETVDS